MDDGRGGVIPARSLEAEGFSPTRRRSPKWPSRVLHQALRGVRRIPGARRDGRAPGGEVARQVVGFIYVGARGTVPAMRR